MTNPFKSGLDIFILAGTYKNRKRFVKGEGCKALLNFPKPTNESPTLLFYTTNYYGNLAGIRNIYINGPLSRLEKEVEAYDPSLKSRITLLDEKEPKNLPGAITDAITKLRGMGSELSDYFLLLNTDWADLNSNIAQINYNKLTTAVLEDIEIKGSSSDIYIGLGNEVEDNRAYARVRDEKLDRKGIVLSSSVSVRWGGAFLINKRVFQTKINQLEALVPHHEKRKISGNYCGVVLKYWTPKILFRGDRRIMKAVSLLKFGYNTLKREISSIRIPSLIPYMDIPIPFPLPYATIPFEDGDKMISDTVDMDIRFILTLGSSDIDNDLEYDLAAENYLQSRQS